jgi:Glucodextranase, domain N
MTSKLGRRAPGGPGIEPRWTHGAKLAVGTAYSTSSRVWYTLDAGCVTEVYYPTIDTPQIRDAAAKSRRKLRRRKAPGQHVLIVG